MPKYNMFEFSIPGRSLGVHLAPSSPLSSSVFLKEVCQTGSLSFGLNASAKLSRANRAPAQLLPMCGEPQQHLSVFCMLINHALLQKWIPL